MNYVFIKLVDFFNFNIYIRLIVEAYQLLLVCSLSELLLMNISSRSGIVSLTFSVILTLICLGCLFLAFYIFYKSWRFFDIDKRTRLEEYLAGIRNNKYARFYPFMALFRRTLMIAWLIFCSDLDPFYLSLGIATIQGFYFSALVLIRPFEKTENNIIEMVNEIIYSTLVIICVFLDTKKEWSSTMNTVYTRIILSNSMLITVIMISKHK